MPNDIKSCVGLNIMVSNMQPFIVGATTVTAFYPRDVYVSAVLATATWVAGWLSVTHRYCIKMAKLILKLF